MERITLDDDRVDIFGRSGNPMSRRRAIGYGSLALAAALSGPSVVQAVALCDEPTTHCDVLLPGGD